MTKVFGSDDPISTQLNVITQGIGGELVPIEGDSPGGGGAVDSVNGQTGVVVLDSDDVSEGATNLYLSAGEQSLIASATQPGDNVSTLTNDANYIDSSGAPVQSVNGDTGAVVLDSDDVSEGATNLYLSAAEQSLIASATQPGDNISTLTNNLGFVASGDNITELNNNANYITSASAPVQSVNGETGSVNLDYTDIPGLNSTNFVTTSDNQAVAGVKSFSDRINIKDGSAADPSIYSLTRFVGLAASDLNELDVVSGGNAVFRHSNVRNEAFLPIKLMNYNVASLPSGQEGDAVYCTNGDAGSACVAVHDGSDWKVISLGATVSSS